MHISTLSKWQHDHNFTRIDPTNERKMLRVVLLTTSMMGLEITAGMIFGSMTPLAMTAEFVARTGFDRIIHLPEEISSTIANARNLPKIVTW
jgi:hypothetical protein